MILFLFKKLKREKNITLLFLILLFVLISLDHIKEKNYININLEEKNHNEHQEAMSERARPAGIPQLCYEIYVGNQNEVHYANTTI